MKKLLAIVLAISLISGMAGIFGVSASGNDIYKMTDAVWGVQGSNGWSYYAYDGANYLTMTFDSGNSWFSNASVPSAQIRADGGHIPVNSSHAAVRGFNVPKSGLVKITWEVAITNARYYPFPGIRMQTMKNTQRIFPSATESLLINGTDDGVRPYPGGGGDNDFIPKITYNYTTYANRDDMLYFHIMSTSNSDQYGQVKYDIKIEYVDEVTMQDTAWTYQNSAGWSYHAHDGEDYFLLNYNDGWAGFPAFEGFEGADAFFPARLNYPGGHIPPDDNLSAVRGFKAPAGGLVEVTWQVAPTNARYYPFSGIRIKTMKNSEKIFPSSSEAQLINGSGGSPYPGGGGDHSFIETPYLFTFTTTVNQDDMLYFHLMSNGNSSDYGDVQYDIKIKYLSFGIGTSLSKVEDDFIVNIKKFNQDYKYQIWTWQEVTSDAFGAINQWVLSQPYTLGSAMNAGPEGSINSDPITAFNSPDKFYTVAVRVIDGNGNFVGQYKDTYTPAAVGEVVIEKVEVDGVFADGTIVKDIDGGNVGIEVFTNITENVTYEAVVNPGDTTLTPDGNSFDWDISELAPGRYSVNLKAQNGTSDERTVMFNLYKVDPSITYGQMDAMTLDGEVSNGKFVIDMGPTVPAGGWVTYSISEPWRAAIFRSNPIERDKTEMEISNDTISEGEYGIYQVAAYVRRSAYGSPDDGMIGTVDYARDGGKSLEVSVNSTPYAGAVTSSTGEQIIIEPVAQLGTLTPDDIVYSYWRRDARGWVMIRDYNYDKEGIDDALTWTPARIGLYTIQVRAKGVDAGSFEVRTNLEFNITGTDSILTVDDITLSGTDNVDARVPVTIAADVVNPSGEDLLYKYIISNDYIYYVETAYSANPTYVWTPGKAGEYRVSVLVKNAASFGKYDAVQTFTVNVN